MDAWGEVSGLACSLQERGRGKKLLFMIIGEERVWSWVSGIEE